MKKLLLLLIVCVYSTLMLNAQDMQKKWDYKIKSNTNAWLDLKDNESKVKACQIPEDILKNISTEDLFELVLKYPLIYDIFAFNDINMGIDKLLSDFNGIRELFGRKESVNLFIDKYKTEMNKVSLTLSDKSLKEETKGFTIMQTSLLETLLTSNFLLQRMSLSDKEKVYKALSDGLDKKIEQPHYFKGFGFETIVKSNEVLETSLKKTDLRSFPIDPNYYNDTKTYVLTPNGARVTAWQMEESPISVRGAFDSYFTTQYPNAVKMTTYSGYSSTRRFNCHGYAWHRVENGNNSSADVWIGYNPALEEIDPEKKYISDQSYQKLSYPTTNGKIFWSQGDHTAVIVDNTWCISKWNAYTLMKHRYGDCPYGGSGLEYYSKNFNLAINGPSHISDNETVTYSLNNPPRGTLVWSVSNNLQIVSGQNTAQLKVKPSANGIGMGKIYVSINNLKSEKDVDVNMPRVRTINGPTTGRSGYRLDFDASPVYPASMGTYVWSLSPSSSLLTTWQHVCYFTPSIGRYSLSCYFRAANGTTSPPAYLSVNVTNSYSISVYDKTVTVMSTETKKQDKLEYSLYNISTGQVFDKGVTYGSGETFDYSHLPKGIYIFMIKHPNGEAETHRISL